jgi:hypothetical protein
MNETIRIQLQVNGKQIPIDSFSADGIVIDEETSSSPRGMAISFRPSNSITEFRLRRVRMIQDWEPGAFRFNVILDSGSLLCRGVDPLSFPSGQYELSMFVADLEPIGQPIDVDVQENIETRIVMKFRTDRRNVSLTTPVEQFDEQIRNVVLHEHSMVDGQAIPAWLDGPARPRRKACLLNLLAKLRAAKGPVTRSSLIDNIRSILFAEVDRIYVATSAVFVADLRILAANPAKPFYFEGEPKAAMHKRLLDQIGPTHQNLEQDSALFHLQSYRQEGKPSMQAVAAIPPGGDTGRPHYADLDIDLGNPLQDLDGLFTHFGELLDPGQTDHLALAAKLAKGPTAEFLYYKVVRT